MTPILERLVFDGRASFNTFIAGGSERSVLNIDDGHFIIITSLTYSCAVKLSGLRITGEEIEEYVAKLLTQVRIFSAKSNNTFLFRDNFILTPATEFGAGEYWIVPQNTVSLNTMLVHETDVAFTFSSGGALVDHERIVSPTGSIARPVPFDYGKQGQTPSLAVRTIGQVSNTATAYQVPAGDVSVSNVPAGGSAATELAFPVNAQNAYIDLGTANAYPILNVGYFSIQGTLTNILASI